MSTERWFLTSSVWILGLSILAKAASMFTGLESLPSWDVVFGMNSKSVLLLSTAWESIAMALLLTVDRPVARLLIVAVTGGQFLLYRIANGLLGGGYICPCLGNIPKWFGLSNRIVDPVLWVLAMYFAVGGAFMLWRWVRERPNSATSCELELGKRYRPRQKSVAGDRN